METQGRIKDPKAMLEFILAGNSRFTLVSGTSGERFTFKVNKKEDVEGIHFVSLLNGSDNDSAYRFIGTIFDKNRYAHSKRSKVGVEALSVKAFAWSFASLVAGRTDNAGKVEFWHEGKCGRCGRTLTVPGSVLTGIGPECARQMDKH